MSPAPVIIAVDGRSGAGKTTLAVELAARLRAHHKVSLFHLEDIYPGWDGLAAGVERYVSTVLTPLSRGEAATWTSWDWENHYDGEARVTLPAEIVIVEGVGAAAEAARPMLDAVVWAESPDDVRRTRALDRDGATYEPYWDQWAAQEEEWLGLDDVPGNADLRVQNLADGSAPTDLLHLLPCLPALAPVLAPELSARRGLRLHAERLDALPDAPALFQSLYGTSPNAVWLDSSNAGAAAAAAGQEEGTEPEARTAAERSRFSIMADDAGTFGQFVTHRAGISLVSTGSATAKVPGPFFRWLDTVWGRRAVRTPDGYPGEFTLGWLGCLGYELKRETGGSDLSAPTPDAALIFAGRAVVLDHAGGAAWLLALEASDAGEWLARARAAVEAAGSGAPAAILGPAPETGGSTDVMLAAPPAFRSRDTGAEYREKITAAQHQIAQGNTYEVCLTTTLEARVPEHSLDPWTTYLALRHRNPAPFASYLRLGNLAVASTSPERFLKIASDGGMRAEPIKGTRRRAADPQEDRLLREDLAASLKDRAENIMIVDLLRNDLSHFAEPGSVTVSRLCAIESYATVHQMVSTIDARLLPGAPRAEAVAACFPAGSMTGAPKISTMAILDELEAGPRGLYSGAIGYFSLNAAADLAVAIRTLVVSAEGDGTAELSLGVGGAITSDSVPDDEYEEIRTKAYGVLSTLGSVFPGD
ncbi:aminodeoxychorismate synthase component I [Pseudarthrobacter niigatensis]|uniref:Anthranilate synthase component 1/para-aminobenzoate synthetase n=1 Tax=Pseudarthrobacter niigatensis TaxID=369935 RepID=A0AAJ1SWX5_9MICC|nr:aminodeoxychorismate synthase component I [Pseudarthrobacter niigatensis]MDQ0145277.1 anthranilate synthase component 1/para-aminobenzoate synthetase [Pseudarthrobacter niigatensis]MDQ0265949.1 anthranilate synthase component 1/para-aminobenzoate synthetase [Pseudarthrobacter niigatensis]